MLNIFEVNETNKMIEQENLDVRTITLGISLMDCIDSDLDKLNKNIYEKITKVAKNLVSTGQEIEKDFGFNINKVNLDSANHKNWYRKTVTLLDDFEVVSFDNLALEQINFRRFITDEHWNSAYQGEHSMYINAVSGYFAPSSRSNEKTNWDKMSLKEFFKQKEMNDGVY